MAYLILFVPILVTLSSYLPFSTAQLNSTAKSLPGVSSIWTNNDNSIPTTIRFTDGSVARFILLRRRKFNTTSQLGFGFGFCFYCTYSADQAPCYLAVVFVEMANDIILTKPSKVVWSANRDNPVGQNATLLFSASQSLVLYDTESTTSPVWSAKTTGVLVSAVSVTEKGNLVILDQKGIVVWQSSDHLTDTLLDGQKLTRGKRLTSSVSSSNMSRGLFYLRISMSSLAGYSKADNMSTPTRYLDVDLVHDIRIPLIVVEFANGTVTFCYLMGGRSLIFKPFIYIRNMASVQILKLDSDGGLRIYGWEPGKAWEEFFCSTTSLKECQIPLTCGTYGVCNVGAGCTCPRTVDGVEYFNTSLYGCTQVPIEGTFDHYRLVNFGNLSYYSYYDNNNAVPGLEDEVSCIQACGRNTNCQAAFFKFDKVSLKGYCFLVTNVLTLMNITRSNSYSSSSYIKIRISSQKNSKTTSSDLYSHFVLALFACFAFLLAVLMVTIVVMLVWQKKKIKKWNDHAFLEQVSSEIPIKSFLYSELYIATAKFSKKLGQGGFGTVFKGVLKDGTAVAVKRLETMRGTKEFLAEVESIGTIHHINLVRLIGFCANRKHRMLVYEYISKGSLDKWIFCKNSDAAFDWNTRKKIVIDIAKGLTYLHEECRHKIAHLDVKPHNILLDDNFNAKLSGFGMSKLISRDESQVVTGVRGTLGYLAPEWEDSRITVKADVYSFGILLLEITTGRKILDYSQHNSDVHLRSLLEKKAFENRLKDMVVSHSGDVQNHVEEAIDMMRLGMWCSDGDYNRRPSMSKVVKILEGEIMPLEPN